MTDMNRDELVEELQELLVQVLADAEASIDNLNRQRVLEVKTVTMRLQTEHCRDQLERGERLKALGGHLQDIAKTVESLPKGQRDDLAAQIAALSARVDQVLAGGPDRPMLLDELDRWTALRKDHAQEKKVKTDQNRIRDFVQYAGNKPVNRYRFSEFQGFTNTLARSPANMVKERVFHGMTREQAANHNDTLKERRFPTLRRRRPRRTIPARFACSSNPWRLSMTSAPPWPT